MSKQAEADLILKLYDLRREVTMREARNWFFMFNPTTPPTSWTCLPAIRVDSIAW